MLGSELGGLIDQLPRGLIVLTCGSGLLWIFLMLYFSVIRPARKRQQEAKTLTGEPIPAYIGAPSASLAPMTAQADLPDLDMLMGPATESAYSPQAAPTALRRLGSTDVKLDDGLIVHANEMLLILRDPRDDSLIVQVGDTGHKSLNNAPAARDLLKRLLGELNQQKGGVSTPPPSATSTQTAAKIPLPTPISGQMPGDLPKFTQIKDEIVSRGAFRPAKTEMPEVPELNIPGAIEAFLQYKKSFSPEYARRAIHVHPAISGGVRIEVDGKFYDAVSDVEDPAVRTFLQETIAEWQSRQ